MPLVVTGRVPPALPAVVVVAEFGRLHWFEFYKEYCSWRRLLLVG
jgi:hypothetical protein